MAYRYDSDLEFLGKMSSEDLSDLVNLLIYDPKDGEKRLTENLSFSEEYEKYGKDYQKYYKRIIEELQLFGGNTIANIARGGGVYYREILCDVCDKLKVNYNKKSNIDIIEWNFLSKILETSLDNLDDKQKEKLKKELSNAGINIKGNMTFAAMMAIFKAGGFASYQTLLIVTNYIWNLIFSKGISLAGNAALTSGAAVVVGPIGWTILGGWTIINIASTAYRVTVPCCIIISLLRIKYKENVNK
ncbi:DUF3944 domain-containing protein [Campylobacter sp. VBCF_06 NA8]|uniref:DUF3944 domain-containing protein n=1 Tax=Campylobacter sp. VBCF_06 NA8 TaxID=2983822 RepID=UPI0022E9DBC4|nr:DUF3944 domain-containing protein [Campylobacter sp. VBCF_06 NA8]MDA3046298.1 DUF3944 domain-containing protein [Campylobacter sp. VBCF_06 NA8]